MATIRSLRVMLFVDHSKVPRGMAAAEREVARGAKRMNMAMMAALTAGGTAVGVGFMRSLQMAAKRQRLEVSMGVLGGTKKLMDDIRARASKSSIPMDEWLEGANRLLGAGIQVDKINGLMESMANLAAGTGNSIRELGLVYSQVFSKGKLQGEEMLQFMERNVNLMPALMEVLDKSAQEIVKMQAKGLITPEDVRKAMKVMTSGDGRFAGMDAALLGTMSGASTNFMNQLNNSLESIGKTLLFMGTEIINQFAELVSVGNIFEQTLSLVVQPLNIIALAVRTILAAWNDFNERFQGWPSAIIGGLATIFIWFVGIYKIVKIVKKFLFKIKMDLLALAGWVGRVFRRFGALARVLGTVLKISTGWAGVLLLVAGVLGSWGLKWFFTGKVDKRTNELRKQQKILVQQAKTLDSMRKKGTPSASGAGALFGSAEAASIFAGEAEELSIQRDILAVLERIAAIEDEIANEQRYGPTRNAEEDAFRKAPTVAEGTRISYGMSQNPFLRSFD